MPHLALPVGDIFNDIPRECIPGSIDMILSEKLNSGCGDSNPRQFLVAILEGSKGGS